MSGEFDVPLEEAMERLAIHQGPDGPTVHTLAQSGLMLIGADWPLSTLRELMQVLGVQESGPDAESMGHALVVLRPDRGPLFIATKGEPEKPG